MDSVEADVMSSLFCFPEKRVKVLASGGEAEMPVEKYYCGNCGAPLYYGQKFKEHTLVRPCLECQVLNPIYFHYCYRCGAKIPPLDEAPEEQTL